MGHNQVRRRDITQLLVPRCKDTKLIAFSARNKFFVFFLTLAAAVAEYTVTVEVAEAVPPLVSVAFAVMVTVLR